MKPDVNGATPFRTPANITAFFKSAPADVDFLVSFYHEHDGNIADGSLTVANYRAGCTQLAKIVHDAGHLFGPNHNGMVKDASKKPQWGLYKSIWMKNEAPLEVCDFWSADCYSENYEDPATRYQPLADYASEIGLPLFIGELGSPYTDAAKQAAWAKKMRAWVEDHCAGAAWWHSQVDTTKTDWHMRDASAAAWYSL
jgi:hypothetical protein